MKCCASPTTSTAAERAASLQRPAHTPSPPTARDLVNALLFREILRPLAGPLGPVGDLVLGGVADDLFIRRAR